MLTWKLQILYFPVQAKKSAIRLLTPRERFHIQSVSPHSRSQGQTERRKSVRTPVSIVKKGFKFTNTDLCSSTKDTTIRFGAFSRLPPELRLMIWESARPDPRIVRLLKSKHSSALYSNTPRHTRIPCHCPKVVSALLPHAVSTTQSSRLDASEQN